MIQKWLVKKSNFVWRKKTHPEHKYSVTFVSKIGTIGGSIYNSNQHYKTSYCLFCRIQKTAKTATRKNHVENQC